jgi:galactitol-specific phosphotransferase system IIC component
LECLPNLLVGYIFNGDGVITFADFAALLQFALALLRYIFKSRRGSWVRDILGDIILQNITWVSATTLDQ